MEIIFEPQTAHLTIISVNDCRSDPDGCLYEHKTPTVSLFVNIQGPSLPPLYLSTCVYVYTYGSKGKIPFNRWSTTVQKRRLRRGKEGWTNSYTFRRRFVPSFEKPSHRCPFYFLSFSFFFRQRGHCPWLNGREKGQKRFIEIRRSEVERRQKPLFVKPLLAARRFLFAVFWPLVANLSPASRCTHTQSPSPLTPLRCAPTIDSRKASFANEALTRSLAREIRAWCKIKAPFRQVLSRPKLSSRLCLVLVVVGGRDRCSKRRGISKLVILR